MIYDLDLHFSSLKLGRDKTTLQKCSRDRTYQWRIQDKTTSHPLVQLSLVSSQIILKDLLPVYFCWKLYEYSGVICIVIVFIGHGCQSWNSKVDDVYWLRGDIFDYRGGSEVQ